MGSKSADPRLACAAVCAMGWKWRGAGGVAQVRFRHGVRAEVSVDDVRTLFQKRLARGQNTEQPLGSDEAVHVRVFHVDLQRGDVAGSPRTPCSNVNLDEAGKPQVRFHLIRFTWSSARSLVQPTASTLPGTTFSSSSSFRSVGPFSV